jgi:MFS family permease
MQTAKASSGYRAYVMFILVVVYTFNFIDRQIVGILAVPIKAELALNDTQLSLMGGLAFALFYTFLGIPVAYLADRGSRTWIMTIALTVWSGMTAVCGLAQNFWHLFLARLGVGVGEAGGVAPAYSLISDYFPPHQRARALAVYSFGIPIGGALGIVLGGVLSSVAGWRSAFIVVGLAGLLLAPIFRLTVREPVRGQFDGANQSRIPVSMRVVAATLSGKPSFWALALGAASSSMIGYGLLFWLPSFLVRSFGADLPGFFDWLPAALVPNNPSAVLYASYFYGAVLLLGGVVGIGLGGILADRLGAKNKAAYAQIPALAFLLAVPFFLVGVMTDSLTVAFFAFLVPSALSLVWLGPVLSAFQHLVTPNMRATASAIFLFINNLIGIGLGNLVIGALSDGLSERFGDESLRYAILSGTVFYLAAAALLFVASKNLDNDWER